MRRMFDLERQAQISLDRLVPRLEAQFAVEMRADPDAWRRRFAAYSAVFEPEIGPQEGPPADYKGDL